MKTITAAILSVSCLTFGTAVSFGALIGSDEFEYANGSIGGQSGGVGWEYLVTNEGGSATRGVSIWSGSATVSGGTVTTSSGNSAFREFLGTTTGGSEGSNAREGAIRSGAFFIGVDYHSNGAANQWGGISTYTPDGNEELFIGRPSSGEFFGFQSYGSPTGSQLSSVAVAADTTYRLVAAIDYDHDLIQLWVDPDQPIGGTLPIADLTRSYTSENWSSTIRLASGNSVTWDNLIVATTFAEVVPEPSTYALAFGIVGLIGAIVYRRRRR